MVSPWAWATAPLSWVNGSASDSVRIGGTSGSVNRSNADGVFADLRPVVGCEIKKIKAPAKLAAKRLKQIRARCRIGRAFGFQVDFVVIWFRFNAF